MSQHHFPEAVVMMNKAVAALTVAIQDRHPDPHTYVAAILFDIQQEEVNEDQRQFAKRITYKHLYDDQPPQCRVFEPWINNRSGEPYTAVIRGRHRKTLVPMVAYLDKNGMAWFGDVDEFQQKFTRKPGLHTGKDVDYGELEARALSQEMSHGQGT
jgi:hypothetical protein